MLARTLTSARSACRIHHAIRHASSAASATSLVTTEVVDGGVAVVRLNNAPVNVLTAQTLGALQHTLRELRDTMGVASIVLSSTQRVFSAGLDITQMHKPQLSAFTSYIAAVQDTFLELYNYPKPVIAAVVGAAPAGGCWLALQSDLRIMANNVPKATIGLNETRLGIIAPFYFREPLIRAVGFHNAEKMLQLGSLVDAKTALHLGLIDELSESPEAAAILAAREWSAIPAAARRDTKTSLREPLVAQLRAERQAETTAFWSQIQQPHVQNAISKYLNSLAKKA